MPETPAQPVAADPLLNTRWASTGIVAAVAPRVAPQQAPSREHQAPDYAVLPDRLRPRSASRWARTCSAAGSRARSPAGRDDRRPSATSPRRIRAGVTSRPRCVRRGAHASPPGAATQARPAFTISSPSDEPMPLRPSRSASSRGRRAGDDDDVVALLSRGGFAAKASRRRRLTRLRSTAPPTFATRTGRAAGPRRAASGTRRGRGGGSPPSAPGGRHARTRRCARDDRAPIAAPSPAIRSRAACAPCRGGA